MKKVIAFILITLMLLSFVACDIDIDIDNKGKTNKGKTNKEIVLTDEQMNEYVEIVELNESNWKNYFYIETITFENRNAFGEIISTEAYYPMRPKIDNHFAYALYNHHLSEWSDWMQIECINTVTNNEQTFYPLSEGYNMVDCRESAVKMEELSFVRSSCKMIFFNIPEEYWNTNSDGQKYVCYSSTKIYKGTMVEADEILSTISV